MAIPPLHRQIDSRKYCLKSVEHNPWNLVESWICICILFTCKDKYYIHVMYMHTYKILIQEKKHLFFLMTILFIQVVPVGVNKGVKKIVSSKIPNMSRLEDMADLVTKVRLDRVPEPVFFPQTWEESEQLTSMARLEDMTLKSTV